MERVDNCEVFVAVIQGSVGKEPYPLSSRAVTIHKAERVTFWSMLSISPSFCFAFDHPASGNFSHWLPGCAPGAFCGHTESAGLEYLSGGAGVKCAGCRRFSYEIPQERSHDQ